ncbi:hypothetical protein [Polyangium sp. 6x1]|uniref:hypothetical protein n=1 Tax=Polyangium sp. 6x1 TaxID=3042689 RepID=UPI0024830452|nr:hypothetical protein [Polyangium sp. 6x1]MDI1449086.1 hypothetical protein [Polyangium sp. 6x1]
MDATSAGSGGTGGGGTGGAGGVGAGGAGVGGSGTIGWAVCDFFFPAGESLVLDTPPNLSALSPKLVRSGLDEKNVVLAFMGGPVEGPAGALGEIHLRFFLDPWNTWPPVEGSNVVLADAQGPFAVSKGASMELSVLRDMGAAPISYSILPALGMLPKSTPLPLDGTQAALLRMHTEGHIIGYGRPHEGAMSELLVGFGRYSGQLPKAEGFTPVGCTKGEVLMDAVSTAKGALVGFASNEPASASGCTGSVSTAKQVVVARVTDGNPVVAELAASTLDGQAAIQGLAMAARSDGAWLAWGRTDALGSTSLSAQVLDAAGNFVDGPFEIAKSNDIHPATLGAGRMKDDLVVAWSSGALTSTRIEVARISAGGYFHIEATIEEKSSVSQPIAVLVSPTGNAVLLVYSVVSEVDQTSRIRLQRLVCGVYL